MCNLIVLLALLASAPVTTAEATATRLDGAAIVGELRSWDDARIVMMTADGEQAIPSNQLLSLHWPSAPPKDDVPENSSSIELELVDGSRIPIDGFQSSTSRASVSLAAPLPTPDKTLVLPRKQLAAVRLQPLSASAAKQWREIRQIQFPSDVLVLLKRGGQSLDYVEGVIGDVSADKIDFKLDGDALRIDREKVAGFIFYRTTKQLSEEPRCLVRGRSGLHAVASHVRLENNLLSVTTLSGAELHWPLPDIHSADFSAGKLVYLSDIDPLSENWTPLVGLPAGATLAAEYGRPRRDQAAYGGPLMLQMHDSSPAPADREMQSFNKGLALRSRTEVVFRLPAGFRRFSTLAGIDPSTSASGNVVLQIYGDDRLLFDEAIAGGQPPRSVELDVADVKRLKILVDYGSNLDSGDWLNLCNARLIK